MFDEDSIANLLNLEEPITCICPQSVVLGYVREVQILPEKQKYEKINTSPKCLTFKNGVPPLPESYCRKSLGEPCW